MTVKYSHLAVVYHFIVLAIMTVEAIGPLPMLRSQGEGCNRESGEANFDRYYQMIFSCNSTAHFRM